MRSDVAPITAVNTPAGISRGGNKVRPTMHSQGMQEDIVTKVLIREVYRMECEIDADLLFGTPMCIPHGKGRKISPKGKRQEFNII
ncbi:hypothetical protein GCM10008018_53720 [Paenibacillus marchantiophytorum]|uniref:Uncharacterized protein n=1 Tax=Paenibacillus marchantiophytorum TaxID=1619310 RepID=A0ABQ1F5K1_9BACL|nr:hypothetical protein [Paenibacillus marchantiophytorum]GGA00660.1 hypothetical protein GCM10008018_53720 [Paenibacillus marchantiophytorum]